MTGISGVPVVLVAEGATSVAVGRTGCPAGETVHTGVGDARVNLPQADVKNIKVERAIRTDAKSCSFHKPPQKVFVSSSDIDAGFRLKFPAYLLYLYKKNETILNPVIDNRLRSHSNGWAYSTDAVALTAKHPWMDFILSLL